MFIGLDFDNTLVEYGHAFRDLAVERGLVPESTPADKKVVRALVWEHHDDIEWQKLQVAVYGYSIDRGRLMDGAADFLNLCRDKGVPLCIVSHKSEYAAIDPGGVNLRQASLDWMESNGFFLPVCSGGFGFSPGEVFFESKRTEKVARINRLGCTVFVDDLPEVLDHPDLDESVERILFRNEPSDFECCALSGPWRQITEYLFPSGGL